MASGRASVAARARIGAARLDAEATGAHAQHGREHALSTLGRTVRRRAHRPPRRAALELHLVQARRVADRDARARAQLAGELEERADREAVQASVHVSRRLEARLDARARAQHLADARQDRLRVALLAHVRRGAGAELAHALQQVLLPREEDHGCVAQRDVATQRPREREAVELRHEDVAHHQLGRDAVAELQRGGAIERLVDDAPRAAEDVGDEPGDAGIVVGHHDAAPVERHVGGRPAPARTQRGERGRPVRAGEIRLEPRRERHGPLGSPAEAHRAVGPGRDELAHAGDRPPHRGHHLRPLAERHEAAPRRAVGAVHQRASHLVGEPVTQLLERRLAQRDSHRAPSFLLDRLVARPADRLGRDGLGERAAHPQRDEARRLLLLAEGPHHHHRRGLGQRVVQQRLHQLRGGVDVRVEEQHVRRRPSCEIDRELRVVGSLVLEDDLARRR